jgi:hypothetical protein
MTGQDTMSEELQNIIALTKQCYEKMQKAGARQRVSAFRVLATCVLQQHVLLNSAGPCLNNGVHPM